MPYYLPHICTYIIQDTYITHQVRARYVWYGQTWLTLGKSV